MQPDARGRSPRSSRAPGTAGCRCRACPGAGTGMVTNSSDRGGQTRTGRRRHAAGCQRRSRPEKRTAKSAAAPWPARRWPARHGHAADDVITFSHGQHEDEEPRARRRRWRSFEAARSSGGNGRRPHPGERRPAPRRGTRRSGQSSARVIACASAGASPTGTRLPRRPSWRISRGPLGQSVETTGVPTASASISTVGSPSQAEERTNSAERAM